VNEVYRHTSTVMGTVVTIEVVGGRMDDADEAARRRTLVAEAFEWFHRVEACCTRFDPGSELMRLTASAGVPTEASPMLFEAVQFALAVAEDTDGAFDPTVGLAMEARGFNREHRTGREVRTPIADTDRSVTYRDVEIDRQARTIMLRRPLVLDLGAVAKGMAVDMAARELGPLSNFAIDAGGDLFLSGLAPDGEVWSVGIRHPRQTETLIETIHVTNTAVCTSGDYVRRAPGPEDGHHILVPGTKRSATGAISATVVAPSAMLADALATAAFVLGPAEGIRLLDRHGVEGLIVSPALERFETRGLLRDPTILSNTQGLAHHRAGGPHGVGDGGRRSRTGRNRAR
jgi:thiamine biosynthesis lipoprotein